MITSYRFTGYRLHTFMININGSDNSVYVVNLKEWFKGDWGDMVPKCGIQNQKRLKFVNLVFDRNLVRKPFLRYESVSNNVILYWVVSTARSHNDRSLIGQSVYVPHKLLYLSTLTLTVVFTRDKDASCQKWHANTPHSFSFVSSAGHFLFSLNSILLF